MVLTSILVTVVQFRAVVVEMNSHQRQMAVQTADGQRRVFNLQPEMDIGGLKVGDDVALQATEAVAIELEKPLLRIQILNSQDFKIPNNANASPKESNSQQKNLT
jgi:hypothetical protein